MHAKTAFFNKPPKALVRPELGYLATNRTVRWLIHKSCRLQGVTLFRETIIERRLNGLVEFSIIFANLGVLLTVLRRSDAFRYRPES